MMQGSGDFQTQLDTHVESIEQFVRTMHDGLVELSNQTVVAEPAPVAPAHWEAQLAEHVQALEAARAALADAQSQNANHRQELEAAQAELARARMQATAALIADQAGVEAPKFGDRGEESAPAEGASAKKIPAKKILLVEPVEIHRVLFGRYFQGYPFQISFARTQAEAESKQAEQAYDLVLNDWSQSLSRGLPKSELIQQILDRVSG